jgi:hypothetical protein
VCGLEASRLRIPWPALGRSATENKDVVHCGLIAKVLNFFQILKIEIMGAEWLGGTLVLVGITLHVKKLFFVRKQTYFISEVRLGLSFYLASFW